MADPEPDAAPSPPTRRFALSAPQATVLGAILTVVGGAAGALIKGYFDQSAAIELEKIRLQTELILKAIDTPEQATAAKTLKFFARGGLIPAYEQRVLSLAEEDEGAAIPALRAPPGLYRPVDQLLAASPQGSLARAVGVLEHGATGGRCTAWLVAGNRVVAPGFCIGPDEDPASAELRLGYAGGAEGERFPILALEERTGAGSRGLVVLSAGGNPNAIYGSVPLVVRAPEPGEPVFMLHHPGGGPQQISDQNCIVQETEPVTPDNELRFVCRTDPGSAGGPVFASRDSALLGIHVAREGPPPTDQKLALLMTHAVEQSRLLSSLRSTSQAASPVAAPAR